MNFEKLFPDNREQGDTQIRQCHLVMLRMLKILDHLCRKHSIQYFLCSGTLKGAVIYNGFKPWDDDLDIGMTRNNYEKFVEKAVPELPNEIFFQTPETDAFFPSCHRVEAKLRDKYSSYNFSGANKKVKYHYGLMIDILVFDRAFLPHNFFIFLMNRSLKFFFHKKGNKQRAETLKWISKYSPFRLVYSNSTIDGRIMIKKGANYFKAKEISSLVKINFEGMATFIPQGWNSYLERKYGIDYMRLPPPEKQKGHHSDNIPDPFAPCDHKEILYWRDNVILER